LRLGYAPGCSGQDFREAADVFPTVVGFVGFFVGDVAVPEREDEAATLESGDHFLEAVGVAVHARGTWLHDVLGDVPGDLVTVGDELHVDDEAIAGGDVPFTRELGFVEVGASAQHVQVWVPVSGGYTPFDLDRRCPTSDPATPPLAPPQAAERSVKAIKSVGERELVCPKSKRDEPSRLSGEPSAEPCDDAAGASDCARDAESVVAVIGADTEFVGTVSGTLHPGAATASVKTSEPVRRYLKSDQSQPDSVPVSQPTRVSKSHVQSIVIPIPARDGVPRRPYTCFWRVK
jgi:hypothetical protein